MLLLGEFIPNRNMCAMNCFNVVVALSLKGTDYLILGSNLFRTSIAIEFVDLALNVVFCNYTLAGSYFQPCEAELCKSYDLYS